MSKNLPNSSKKSPEEEEVTSGSEYEEEEVTSGSSEEDVEDVSDDNTQPPKKTPTNTEKDTTTKKATKKSPEEEEVTSGSDEEEEFTSGSDEDSEDVSDDKTETPKKAPEGKSEKAPEPKPEVKTREVKLTPKSPEEEEVTSGSGEEDEGNEELSKLSNYTHKEFSKVYQLFDTLDKKMVTLDRTVTPSSIQEIEKRLASVEAQLKDFQADHNSISCIKFEVKQLKKNLNANVQQRSAPVTAVSQLSNNDNTTTSNEEIANLKKSINQFQLQDEKLQKELRCIKYELKNLKKSSNHAPALPVQERAVTIPLSAAPDALQEEKLQKELRCIKYELKNLKKASKGAPVQALASNSELPNDLLERLNNAERQSSDASAKAKEAQDLAIDTNSTIDGLMTENKALRSDIKCLKYELRKLKIPSNTNGTQEHAATTSDPLQDEKLQKELRCLKYELKNLKKLVNRTPIQQESVQERAVPVPTDALQDEKLQKELRCLKYELKNLKKLVNRTPAEQAPAVLAAVPDPLQDEKLQKELRCIKYELKNLKKASNKPPVQQEPVQERASPAPAIPDDLLERLENVEKQLKDANDKAQEALNKANEANQNANEANQKSIDIAVIADNLKAENQTINGDLKCLKYEVKKLKETPLQDHAAPAPVQERAAPIAAVPDDLLERLENVERQSKSASDRAEEANTKADDLKSYNQAVLGDLKCLKYEVKKLKEAPKPEPVQERSAPVPAIPDDLLDRLEKCEKSAKDANKKADANQKSINGINDAFSQHKGEHTHLNHEINCLKYETKKLKKRPIARVSSPKPSATEEAAPAVIPDEIYESIQKAQETANKANSKCDKLKADNDKIHGDLKCLKYEVKKLKEAPKPEPVQERAAPVPAIPDDLLDRLEKCEKSAKDANDKAKKAQQRADEGFNKADEAANAANGADQKATDASSKCDQLKADHDRIHIDLKCLKYEVKKLKEAPKPEPVQERAAPVPAIPDDLLDRLEKCEKSAKDANKKADANQKSINGINDAFSQHKGEHTHLNHEINCLKYETKKLKKRPIARVSSPKPSATEEAAPAVIPDEIYESIQKAQETANKANSKCDKLKADNDKIHGDLKCLKYEVKKLKEAPKPEPVQERAAPVPAIPDDLLDRLEKCEKSAKDANKKADSNSQLINQHIEDHKKLNHDLNCLKYEVKKLKKAPKPEPVQERAAPVPAIPDDLLDRLEKCEKSAKDANDKADANNQSINNINNTINQHIEDHKKLNRDLNCLKYEVKKLKKAPKPEPVQERAAPVPAIPDDLLERLANCEKSAKDANDKANGADQKATDAHTKYDELKTQQQKLHFDVGCLKYEVKKLKERPIPEAPIAAPVEERAAPVPAIPDDLLDRLEKCEKSAKDANDKADSACQKADANSQSIENINNTINQHVEDHKKLNRDLNCLKYEVKKLKKAPKPEPVQERAAPVPAIPDDLLDRLANCEKSAKSANDKADSNSQLINQHIEDHKKLNHDLNCLKYEVKKLKKAPKAAPVQERAAPVPAIPDDLLDRLANCEKSAKDANDKAEANNQSINNINNTINQHIEDHKKLNHDLNCLKYEVKKLKKAPKPEPVQERAAPVAAVPDDLLDRLEKCEKSAKDANKKADSNSQLINQHVEDHKKLNHDLNCLKYEVKKLKKAPKPEPVQERAAPVPAIPDDLLERLANCEKSAKDANDKAEANNQSINNINNTINQHIEDHKKLNHDLNCLKYEVKKLKKAPKPEPVQERAAPVAAVPDDLLDRLEKCEKSAKDANKKADSNSQLINQHVEDHKKLNHDLNCLKYEVKKLKKAPKPEPVQERAAPVPAIPDDLLDRLEKCEKSAKDANDKADSACQKADANSQSIDNINNTINQHIEDHKKLNRDLNCLKYEVKKLKKAPKPEPVQERAAPVPAIPDDLLDRLANCEKSAKSANDKADSNSQLINQHIEDHKKLNHDLNCLKYEVKKLKKAPKPEPVQERAAPVPAIPDDLLERLANCEKSAKDANDKANGADQKATDAHTKYDELKTQQQKLHFDVGCLKYEVKKLKERPIPEAPIAAPVEERAAPVPAIPDDLLERLANCEKSAKDANDKADANNQSINNINNTINQHIEDHKKLNHDLNCLKYEVKKLKKAPKPEPVQERAAPVPAIPDDLLDRLANCEKSAKSANDKADSNSQLINQHIEDHKKLNHDLNCLKYEVKKLKKAPKAAPVQERAAPVPAIPDDLLDRLANCEKSAKDANDKAEANNQSINNINNTINQHIEDHKKLNRDLNCLKYEVKKLKKAPKPEPVQERAAPVPAIPDDLLDRLEKCEKSAKDANKKADSNSQLINQHIEDHKKLNHDLNCLKYEVKKLKKAPKPEPVQERAAPVPAIPDDLLERLANCEKSAKDANDKADANNQSINNINNTINQHIEDHKKLNRDLNCLKYEVKKLKKAPKPEPVQERATPVAAVPDDLLDRLEKCEKSAKDANKKADSNSQLINQHIEDHKKLNHDLNCLKYEVKKLKKAPKPEPVQERAAPVPAIPDDLLERLANCEKSAKDANDKAEANNQSINNINNTINQHIEDHKKLNHDLNCLKYEVKKLKKAPKPEPVQERAAPVPAIPDDLLDRLEKCEKSAKDANKKADSNSQLINQHIEDHKKLNHDLNCLKYEVKKLKKAPKPEPVQERAAPVPAIPDDLLDRLEKCENQSKEAHHKAHEAHHKCEELTADNQKIHHDLNCLKYEVKKLKKAPKPEPVQERAAPVPAIPDDLLERLANCEKSAKDANDKADANNQSINNINNTINQHIEDHKKLNRDLNCLKYEVKKLKKAPKAAPVQERAAPVPAIPDDLLDRLEKCEKSAKDANKKADSNSQLINQHIEDHKKLNHDLNCLKYEVKKLKKAPKPEPVQERAAPVPAIPDDLLDRLEKCENQSKEAHHKAHEAHHKCEELTADNQKIHHDLNCLKYEVKKLKKAPKPEPVQERAAPVPAIPDDLLERLANCEKSAKDANKKADSNSQLINQHIEDHKKLNHDLNCLKYEVKKLKKAPKAAPVQERAAPVPAIPDDLLDRLEKCEKSIKDINHNINQHKSEHATLNHEINCLKYETKKLKKRPIARVSSPKPSATEEAAPAVIPDEIYESIQKAQETANKANSKCDKLKADNDKIHGDLKCLKYEVKKLKEAPKPEPVQERAAPVPAIPDDLLDRLEKCEKSAKDANKKADSNSQLINQHIEDHKKLNHDLNCLKYEVKKLKKAPKPEPVQERAAPVPAIPDDLLDRLEKCEKSSKLANDKADANNQLINNINNSINQHVEDHKKLNHELNCLKYEVKKLKKAPKAAPVQERAAPVPAIPDDLLDRLEKCEKSIKDINHNINQHKSEHATLNHEINCLKYETKKLKARPIARVSSAKPSNAGEEAAPAVIPDEIYESIQKAQETANKANSKCDKLKADNDKIHGDLKCLKYEVKKLKEAPKAEPVQERAAPVPAIPDDLLDRLEKCEKSAKDANKKADSNSQLINQHIEDHKKLNHDLNCLKYEVKKLKKAPKPEPVQERAAPVPAIPDDLLDRLEKCEKSIKDINHNINQHKSEHATLNHEINCLKYETKKLKARPIARVSSAKPSNAGEEATPVVIPDEIYESIQKAQETANKANSKCDKLKADNDKIHGDLKCLKYETKKLKEAPKAEPVQERAAPVAAVPDDLLDRLEKCEKSAKNANKKADSNSQLINQHVEDHKKLNHDLNCLKYEVKKLKEAPKPEPVQERAAVAPAAEIPGDLLDRVSNAEKSAKDANQKVQDMQKVQDCLKYEIKRLKKKPAASGTALPADILERIDKDTRRSNKACKRAKHAKADVAQIQAEMNCIKYEIKRLKKKPAAKPSNVGERAIPDDLAEQIQNAQDSANKANTKCDKLKAQNDKLINDNKCLKYEIKKLKEQPRPDVAAAEPVQERAAPVAAVPDDLLDRLEKCEKSIKDINKNINQHKSEHATLNHEINCLKYETKKLKARPIARVSSAKPSNAGEEAAPTAIPDEIYESIQNAQDSANKANTKCDKLKSQNDKLISDNRCLKYEIKKLKEAPKPEPVQERAAPVAAVPDDLLDRLEKCEKSSKLANDKADANNQLINNINNSINQHVEDHKKLNHELNCLKYEVKKLKKAPKAAPVQERAAPVAAAIPDDLLDRLEKCEKSIKDINHNINQHKSEHATLNHEINCLKYETKKLKARPIARVSSAKPSNAGEEAAPAVIPDEIYESIQKAQETANKANSKCDKLKADNDKIHSDLKCLKYETKKLKEAPKAEPVQERAAPVAAVPDDLLDRLEKCEKSSKLANDKADANNQLINNINNSINQHVEDHKKLNHELNCLKYEVKKLKKAPKAAPVQERAAPVPAIPDDLLDRLEKCEKSAKDANKKADSNSQLINQHVEDHKKLNHDLNCLKYEVKKLKKAPKPEPVQERAAPVAAAIPDDLLDRVANCEKSAKDANKKADDNKNSISTINNTINKQTEEHKQLKHDVNCLKYETKKLKKRPAATGSSGQAAAIPDDLLQRVDNAEKKASKANRELDQMHGDIKCLKYEVKKLKGA